MADGGMGSLRLSQVHVPCDHRAEFKLSAEAEARRIPFTTEATKRFPPASRYPRRESSNQKDEAAPENAFGRMASDIQFIDEDGVRVIASLYLDQTGQPFELDIWKTDFSRLLRIPERFEGVE